VAQGLKRVKMEVFHLQEDVSSTTPQIRGSMHSLVQDVQHEER